MFNKFLSTILSILHSVLFMSILVPVFSNNKVILKLYLYWLVFIYVGWILFKNKCWLSILENKLLNNKSDEWAIHRYIKNIFPNLKKKHTSIFFYCLNYIALIVLTYKLDILYIGILWLFVYEFFKMVICV